MERFREMQEKWQARWKEAGTFEANPDPKRKKYFITIPYPYISGSLHIGHGRVVTEADVFSRYLRMAGYNVLYPLAFHITGTPVLGISMAIKNRDPAKLELYKNYVRAYVSDEKEVERIVESFVESWNIVNFFIPKMVAEFSKLGLAVDWRRSFTSGDVEHQKLVSWQFHKYKEKDYLVQGKYPVLYCPDAESAAGEDDIIEGDTDPVEKTEFTLLKFLMDDETARGSKFKGMKLVAATLRPETMYGQTNMWINPGVTYVHATVDNEEWIISRDCCQKLEYQEHVVTIREDIPGKDLIGLHCRNEALQRELLILPGSFCNPKIGTGIVTSVPSDAPFDYIALKEVQEHSKSEEYAHKFNLSQKEVHSIKPTPIIKSEGYGDCPAAEMCEQRNITSLSQEKELEEVTQEMYRIGYHTGVMLEACTGYAGVKVTVAKTDIKADLISKKLAATMQETSRVAKHRGGGDIIVAILDGQWFLDFNTPGWKESAKELLNRMQIVPEKYRKQFEDTFDWLEKRPCARKRGIGTPLPFEPEWIIESLSDSTIYMSLYMINHLIKEHEIKGEQLTPEFFDYAMLGKGEVGKVSESTGIPAAALKEMREEVAYWYPLDHRHTFTAHLSNHLSFFMFAHACIFRKEQWPKKVTFHGMVISEGTKMSKSKGNTISLQDIYMNYGSDSFRAFMCNSTSVESTFNWESKEVERMKNHLEGLFDFISGMAMHAQPEEIMQNLVEEFKSGKPKLKERAFVSWFQKAMKQATEAIARMDLRAYSTTVLYDIYGRLKKYANAEPEGMHFAGAFALKNWVKMIAPLVPHHAEELYEKIAESGSAGSRKQGKRFVSTAAWPEPVSELIDEDAEALDEIVEQTKLDIARVLGLIKVEKPRQIVLITSEEWKYALFQAVKAEMETTRDIGEIHKAIMLTSLKQHGQDIFKMLPKIVNSLPPHIPQPKQEHEALLEAVQYISTAFGGAEIIVKRFEEVKGEAKAKSAMPGKPAILVK